MVAENSMRDLLRQHAGATRAGQFGDFELAWNIQGGVASDGDPSSAGDSVAIEKGAEFRFSVRNNGGSILTVDVRNDLTGNVAVPGGFQAQTVDPTSGTIVVGADPSTGQARMVFNAVQGNGADFTSVLSETRGGQTPAFAAVKWQGDKIVGIRINGFSGLDFSTQEVRIISGPAFEFARWSATERL